MQKTGGHSTQIGPYLGDIHHVLCMGSASPVLTEQSVDIRFSGEYIQIPSLLELTLFNDADIKRFVLVFQFQHLLEVLRQFLRRECYGRIQPILKGDHEWVVDRECAVVPGNVILTQQEPLCWSPLSIAPNVVECSAPL